MSTTSMGPIDTASARRRLWTPDELAEYLGVTLHCIYAWSSRGGGPRVLHVGGRLRYRPDDVDEWLDRVTDDHQEG
ncbi:helix-turn-helix transcriptional regulator [Cellulomonas sp.]|uniref:helix-turn-helix transcriptional regulator n=1 Tax=Cellulomonas sp. TaxID=40001 RepID=UPI003BAC1122